MGMEVSGSSQVSLPQPEAAQGRVCNAAAPNPSSSHLMGTAVRCQALHTGAGAASRGAWQRVHAQAVIHVPCAHPACSSQLTSGSPDATAYVTSATAEDLMEDGISRKRKAPSDFGGHVLQAAQLSKGLQTSRLDWSTPEVAPDAPASVLLAPAPPSPTGSMLGPLPKPRTSMLPCFASDGPQRSAGGASGDAAAAVAADAAIIAARLSPQPAQPLCSSGECGPTGVQAAPRPLLSLPPQLANSGPSGLSSPAAAHLKLLQQCPEAQQMAEELAVSRANASAGAANAAGAAAAQQQQQAYMLQLLATIEHHKALLSQQLCMLQGAMGGIMFPQQQHMQALAAAAAPATVEAGQGEVPHQTHAAGWHHCSSLQPIQPRLQLNGQPAVNQPAAATAMGLAPYSCLQPQQQQQGTYANNPLLQLQMMLWAAGQGGLTGVAGAPAWGSSPQLQLQQAAATAASSLVAQQLLLQQQRAAIQRCPSPALTTCAASQGSCCHAAGAGTAVRVRRMSSPGCAHHNGGDDSDRLVPHGCADAATPCDALFAELETATPGEEGEVCSKRRRTTEAALKDEAMMS